MIFVDVKIATWCHRVAHESERILSSSAKEPPRLEFRTFVCRDSDGYFKDTQARLSQPVDSYAHC